MSKYRKIDTGEVVSQGQLRKENPNTSFPRIWSAETLSFLGVEPVEDTAPIDVSRTQKALSNGYEKGSDSIWRTVWIVENKSAEEISADDQEQAEAMRRTRDNLLSETDWWASSDLTMTAEQTAYRQALRDITSHASWPHLEAADWPTKP